MNNESFIKRYLVILADRQKGRYFTIFMNTFEDQGEQILDDDVPQKIKSEGRPKKVNQHIRSHLYHHLRHVGQKGLDYLIERGVKQVDGVIIGGHQEMLNDIEKFLPPKLKNKVIGRVITRTDVPVGDLTEKIVSEIKL